jgi:CRP/FNR family transcriptional regulator, cyclic AMP receptor protein
MDSTTHQRYPANSSRETIIYMPENLLRSNAVLHQLTSLGSASEMVEDILKMLGHTQFFDDFTRDDIARLSHFMVVYRAEAGQIIIREGEHDDYMLFILQGRISIVKSDGHGERRAMASAGPGSTLGEMSMIDGEPRFATCIAVDTTTFAVFGRDSMVRIIMEEPALGAKILIKLVTMLSQRLRETSANLLQHLERSNAV